MLKVNSGISITPQQPQTLVWSREETRKYMQLLNPQEPLYQELNRILITHQTGIFQLSNGLKIDATKVQVLGGGKRKRQKSKKLKVQSSVKGSTSEQGSISSKTKIELPSEYRVDKVVAAASEITKSKGKMDVNAETTYSESTHRHSERRERGNEEQNQSGNTNLQTSAAVNNSTAKRDINVENNIQIFNGPVYQSKSDKLQSSDKPFSEEGIIEQLKAFYLDENEINSLLKPLMNLQTTPGSFN